MEFLQFFLKLEYRHFLCQKIYYYIKKYCYYVSKLYCKYCIVVKRPIPVMSREELERHLEMKQSNRQFMSLSAAPSSLPDNIFCNEDSNQDRYILTLYNFVYFCIQQLQIYHQIEANKTHINQNTSFTPVFSN